MTGQTEGEYNGDRVSEEMSELQSRQLELKDKLLGTTPVDDVLDLAMTKTMTRLAPDDAMKQIMTKHLKEAEDKVSRQLSAKGGEYFDLAKEAAAFAKENWKVDVDFDSLLTSFSDGQVPSVD